MKTFQVLYKENGSFLDFIKRNEDSLVFINFIKIISENIKKVIIISYFCKSCLKRHNIEEGVYKAHEKFAFHKGHSGLRDPELAQIFRLKKIIENKRLFEKLVK